MEINNQEICRTFWKKNDVITVTVITPLIVTPRNFLRFLLSNFRKNTANNGTEPGNGPNFYVLSD